MPPRLNILDKRWSTFDSPILPFLAPSIFEPWPSCTRQNFQQKRELKKKVGHTKRVTNDTLNQDRFSHSKPIPRLEDEDEEFKAKYKEMWATAVEEEMQPAANADDPPDQSEPQLVRFTKSTSHKTLAFKGLSFGPWKYEAREAWMEARKRRQALSRQYIQTRIRIEVAQLGIPRTRPRYISLPLKYRFRFAWTVGEWNRRFAVLNLRHEKFMEGMPVPEQVLYHSRRPRLEIPRELKQALVEHVSAASFGKLWEDLDLRTRANLWPEIMITALELYPDAAMNFLEATYRHPYPPAFAVSNCLEFIISNRYSGPTLHKSKSNDRFVDKIRALLYLGAQKRVHLSQASINRLIWHSSMSTSTRLYVTLRQIKHQLHENTLLQFATRLGNSSSIGVRRALKILELMRDQGSSMNTAKTLSIFSHMLDRYDRDSDACELDSKILQFMMENGVSPNIITYNILLKNALRDGEPETGWKIYQMMRDNGIEPDCFTYSILLNDSKRRMDAERMREIVSIVKDKGIQDAHIMTDVLHAIFLLEQDQAKHLGPRGQVRQSPRIPAFVRIFELFSEYFQIDSLRTLIPTITSGDFLQDTEHLHEPGARTLVVLISAYLAHLHTSSSIRGFYDHFLALVAAGDSTARDIAKTGHFWSVLVMNLSRFEDTLSVCLEVVGYMLQHSTELKKEGDVIELEADPLQPEFRASIDGDAKISTHEADEPPPSSTETAEPSVTRRVDTAAPNVYTWSVLLKIFMDHKQPRAAEKVLEMMQEHGIKPNIVTWNTLIGGYSKMQATQSVVDAVRRMEDAGFRPDDITLLALARVNDKRTMMNAMQRYENLKATLAAQQQKDTNEDSEQEEQASDELIRQWDQVSGDLDLYEAEQRVEGDAVDVRQQGGGALMHDSYTRHNFV